MRIFLALLLLSTSVFARPICCPAQTGLQSPRRIAARAFLVSDLERICNAEDDADVTECRMYIFGAFQGLSLAPAKTQGVSHKTDFCVPSDMTAEEMRLAVMRYLGQDLERFPSDRDIEAIAMLSAIVEHAYPCRSQS